MEDVIIFGYKDNSDLRKSFNELSRNMFNTDFESWCKKNFWKNRYQPYSIIHKGKIIANASANRLKFLINGRIKNAVQIGTVMTDEAFRGHGLARKLMEHVIDKYREETDIFYLFANDTVLDFYPKFGFKRRDHFSLSTKDRIPVNSELSYRKLDMKADKDISLLQGISRNRITNSSEFDVIDSHEILGFWANNVFPDKVYYDENADIIVIYQKKDGILSVHDIILTEPADIVRIIGSITDDSITETRFGFPFETDQVNLIKTRIDDDDNAFFVMGDLEKSIDIVYPVTIQA